MTTTPNLALTTWDAGNQQPDLLYNDLLAVVDALVPTPTVADKDLSTPPGSPVTGSLYIVKSPGSGAWAGLDNRLVYYAYDNSWRVIPPKSGWLAFVKDENKQYRFDGSVWNLVGDGGGGSGVSTLNGADGDVTLATDDTLHVDTSGDTITLSTQGRIPIRAVTGTTDTLQATDGGLALHCSNGSAVTITIPANADVAYPVDGSTLVRQLGAGQVTVVAASGVTLRNGFATAKTAGQYTGSIGLHKIDTDVWYLDGTVAAS